jgi:hypothetical protein
MPKPDQLKGAVMLTMTALYGVQRRKLIRWKVTRRIEGRWWWKVAVFDAESESIKITNLTAQQVVTLPIY